MSPRFYPVHKLLPYAMVGVLGVAMLSGGGRADGQALPTIYMYGSSYDSACTDKNLSELRTSLRATNANGQGEMWNAIVTLLCSRPTPADEKYIIGLLAPKVEWTDGSMDEEASPALLKKNSVVVKDIFAKGEAFDAGISKWAGNELRLVYRRDEACVATRRFKYDGGRWRLNAIGFSCP